MLKKKSRIVVARPWPTAPRGSRRQVSKAPLRQEKWALILLSALAFSLMHIVFRNWIAVVLTFFGGLLFARRHLETRSLFVSSFEHALYGCFVFTIGLGQFFFVRLV